MLGCLGVRLVGDFRGPERGVLLGRVTLIEPGAMRRTAVGLRVDGGRIRAIGPEAASQDGRLYKVADLDARLERYQDHYAGFAFAGVLMPSLRTGLRALTAWLRG